MREHAPSGGRRARRRTVARLGALAGAGLVLALAPAPAAAQERARSLLSDATTGQDAEHYAFFSTVSEDGSRLVFVTRERLTPADTDNELDVYVRTDGGFTLLSDGNQVTDLDVMADFGAASADASYVAFETNERLLPSDTDSQTDIYARRDGTLLHISDGGPGVVDSDDPARIVRVTPDGQRTFFHTREPLLATDTDGEVDVYERRGGELRHISDDGPGPDAATPSEFVGATDDGSRVFFETRARLAPGDNDNAVDIYRRDANGALTLVSDNPLGDDQPTAAHLRAMTPDGLRLWIETDEQWANGDTDQDQDVYERSATGAVVHVTRDPSGVESGIDASFAGISDDFSRIFFETDETMAATDVDNLRDVYEFNANGTFHISHSPATVGAASNARFAGVSDRGDVFLQTAERWAPERDLDSASDVYSRTIGGTMTLLSDGPGPVDANQAAVLEGRSGDGSRIVFSTLERLLPGDTDDHLDLYERAPDGTISILSDDTTGPDAPEDAFFFHMSDDGERVYFSTEESLLADDTDNSEDIYLSELTPPPPTPPIVPPPPAGQPPSGSPPRRDTRAPKVGRLQVIGNSKRRVRFKLSERARVRFTLRRGSRVASRFTVTGRAGPNAVRLRTRGRLAPGRYRLVAVAVDGAGNRSRPVGAAFRVSARSRP